MCHLLCPQTGKRPTILLKVYDLVLITFNSVLSLFQVNRKLTISSGFSLKIKFQTDKHYKRMHDFFFL